jgi:formate/nitrite transporter FocA (FNT family)
MIQHAPPAQHDEDHQQKDQHEQEAQERSSPSGKVVYKAIYKEAEDELDRPSSALFWSGLAAGMSMGFSFITEGLLHAHLPQANWTPMITKFGYPMGFLVVVLGRQQLFTENTLTPILPLLKKKESEIFFNVLRLWAVVLVANLIGALAMGLALAKTNAFDQYIRNSFIQLGHNSMTHGFGTNLWRGIFAGWLVALMVWLLPFAESARVWVIIFITYLIGLGAFPHVIAGAVNVFSLAAAGQKPWGDVLLSFLLPTLIGNIIGGVTLVAALNHAQVVAGGQGEDV